MKKFIGYTKTCTDLNWFCGETIKEIKNILTIKPFTLWLMNPYLTDPFKDISLIYQKCGILRLLRGNYDKQDSDLVVMNTDEYLFEAVSQQKRRESIGYNNNAGCDGIFYCFGGDGEYADPEISGYNDGDLMNRLRTRKDRYKTLSIYDTHTKEHYLFGNSIDALCLYLSFIHSRVTELRSEFAIQFNEELGGGLKNLANKWLEEQIKEINKVLSDASAKRDEMFNQKKGG